MHGECIDSDLENVLEIPPLLERSLWTLSGGELAKVAVACALRLEPRWLGIDCALEELDGEARRTLYRAMGRTTSTRIVVADNRLLSSTAGPSEPSREVQPPRSYLDQATQGEQNIAPRSTIFTRIYDSPFDEPDVTEHMVAVNTQLRLAATGQAKHLRPQANAISDALKPVKSGRIDICDLTFRYSDINVLDGASMQMQSGNVYYLDGKNGAGKTTLANLLCGVISPRSGKILFDGGRYEPWTTGNQVVAMHFQNPDLGRTRETPRAQCKSMRSRVGPYLQKKVEDGDSDELHAWARAMGMESVMDSQTISLPYVLRKRADLLACLSSGAPWYFLDEPTLGQDEEFVAHLSTLIRSMTAAGAGLIVVAHENPLRRHLKGFDIQLELGQLRSRSR